MGIPCLTKSLTPKLNFWPVFEISGLNPRKSVHGFGRQGIMSLSFFTRDDPYAEIDSLFNNYLYSRPPSSAPSRSQQQPSSLLWRPQVDVRETENALVVHAELPGLKKEDINVDFHDGVLTLSGEKSQKKKEANERYHRVERSYGKFVRSFALPAGFDSQNISASFDNGVLELTVPKLEEKQEERKRIEIK